MQILKTMALLMLLALSGCTNMQRLAHGYSEQAPKPNTYRYSDGETSTYYTFTINDSSKIDTFVFFYGGSGCPSWKYVMPEYVNALSVPARVFALNKRFVDDRSTGVFSCGKDFHLSNNPEQWVADYSEFITTQLTLAPLKPENVVLVGVSEGVLSAIRVAGALPEITHLALIGDGAYSMRKSLVTLSQKSIFSFEVDSGWKEVSTDPRSIEKSWYGNPYRWWTDIMDIDPLPAFLKLDIPILVGIGEKDESVPVESAIFLEAKFKENGKTNLVLNIYPGADHRLDGNGISYRKAFFGELSRMLQPESKDALHHEK
jgi:pimeloyl-ACP methyl ester carboxylesterase